MWPTDTPTGILKKSYVLLPFAPFITGVCRKCWILGFSDHLLLRVCQIYYLFCIMSHFHVSLQKLVSNHMKLNKFSPCVWKPGTPTTLKPTLWIICESYMTQIWHVCVSVCWSFPYYILFPTWILPCWEFPLAFLQSPKSSWPKITWHAASALVSTPLEKTLLGGGADTV